ncbi:MAG: hypothetical protein CBARDMAM_6448 [uncultured Caballeronia sp.]|nr:MAG: hypothetical protein CBARDMAM_6448 [uncultured Caballeronia sp.]
MRRRFVGVMTFAHANIVTLQRSIPAVVAGHEVLGCHRLFQHAGDMEIVSLLRKTVAICERKLTKRTSKGNVIP